MPAPETGLQHYAPAGRHRPATGIDDLPGDVASRDVRKRQLDAIQTAALSQIQVIERARADADDGAARCGFRIRGVLEPEDLRSAMLMKPDGLHSKPVNPGNRSTSNT
jgi:hypothetical protein